MAAWFNLQINAETLGFVEIRRCQALDITDPAVIADEVCTYDVRVDGRLVGSVTHRYGDRVWRLVSLATDLIAREDA